MSEPEASERGGLVQRVRRAGPSGNYWYAVERSDRLGRGVVRSATFWGDPIAVFRDQSGGVHAVEDRCAHRQLPLSLGRVQGDALVCQYHGWSYGGDGRCRAVSHELGGGRSALPNIRVRAYPTRQKYGLVWIFPGDAALAEQVPLPAIPELDGARPWPTVPIDVTIDAHFSMIVENVCDFNHAYLHRHKQPFTRPRLRGHRRVGDTVEMSYETSFAESVIARLASEGGGRHLDSITLWYDYPYQRSDIAGKYLHWLFMLPEGPRRTRCFFVFLFGPILVPGVGWPLPRLLKPLALRVANALYITPLLAEDKWALEAEQRGFERFPDRPTIELNPIVRELQRLTLEKWEAWRPC